MKLNLKKTKIKTKPKQKKADPAGSAINSSKH